MGKVASAVVRSETKPLRFKVDRRGGRSYVCQMVDAIRQAILEGYYADGDILPSIDELKLSAGVSEIVPRIALRQLAVEGLVIPKRGVGSIVNLPRKQSVLGHVLVVTSEVADNYLDATMSGILRESLTSAGYMASQVAVVGGERGHADFAQLDAMLRQPLSLAVVLTARWGIGCRVVESGVPTVLRSSDPAAGSGRVVGRFSHSFMGCPDDFVAHCRQAGVRTVTEVTFDEAAPWLDSALRGSGIRYDNIHFPYADTPSGYRVVERRMFDAMRELCTKRRAGLPDLFFFGDDYAARGALTAFLTEGVRVPEDVKVVSWVAKGNEPVFVKSLTRFETDCAKLGRECARYVLDVLDGHVLLGMARLIQAATLIVCIALGLSFTMLLVGMDSL